MATTTTGRNDSGSSEDVEAIFNDSVATENQSYKNAPAIVTGVGLLATFVAILVALLDVQLANNRIQGLDLLIHGLSGKFLSSVVAISCAAALVFVEKSLFHPVNTGSSLSLFDSEKAAAPVDICPDTSRSSRRHRRKRHRSL